MSAWRVLLGALLAALAMLCPPLEAAAPALGIPPLTGHVIDQTATLGAAQAQALERTLADFEARKGSQLAVLIVRSTAPEDIAAYALRVAEQWKLGRKKVDDGAILVVALDDRALRIEVGYGLEGALNDATCKRIIEEIVLPRFRQQDFAGGIDAGIAQMMRTIDGEALPAPPARRGEPGDGLTPLSPVLFIAALALGAVLRAWLGKGRGALFTGGAVGVLAWLMAGTLWVALLAALMALVMTWLGPGMLLRGASGLYGAGGGHGSSNGGFRGGGGGFGGGGASGKW